MSGWGSSAAVRQRAVERRADLGWDGGRVGYEKPLVVGEYNAPWPSLYPEATAAMEQAMAAAFAAGAGTAPQQTPEEAAMAGLYEQMAGLPPQLQMFMRGCPKGLEDKRDRINCRELVMRNLLALSAGIRRTVCWNLAPDIPGYSNPLSIMDLLFGKLVLMGYEGGELRHRHPSATTFTLLADRLAGVEADGVTRRRRRGPLLVAWDQRDAFEGEDEPPVAFDWPWPAARATAVDALGQSQPAEVLDGRGEPPGVPHSGVHHRRPDRPRIRRLIPVSAGATRSGRCRAGSPHPSAATRARTRPAQPPARGRRRRRTWHPATPIARRG
jgi:hypothetical protein